MVTKLAEVMGVVDWVPKDGKNAFHGYSYSTEAAIVSSVRKEMALRSLLLVPSVKSVEWSAVTTAKGHAEKLCTLTVTFTVHDGENGTSLAFDVLGQGQDSGDKASYKAMTGATKYALLKLFLIPTGTDPEDEPAHKAPPPAGVAALKHRATAAPVPARSRPQIADVSSGPPEPPPIGEEYAPEPGSDMGPDDGMHRIAAPPATHDRSLTFAYGNGKGTPLADLDDNSLAFYKRGCLKTLADPAKSNFHGKETLNLATLNAELKWRGLTS